MSEDRQPTDTESPEPTGEAAGDPPEGAGAQASGSGAESSTPRPSPHLEADPIDETCTFDEFLKVDLRIARVVAAEDVPEARKLLKLTVSLGGDERRTVFAGIKAAYDPADLVGRLVILAANLAPRTMRFGVSEGMVLAAGPGGSDVFLLGVDEGSEPGQRVT